MCVSSSIGWCRTQSNMTLSYSMPVRGALKTKKSMQAAKTTFHMIKFKEARPGHLVLSTVKQPPYR